MVFFVCEIIDWFIELEKRFCVFYVGFGVCLVIFMFEER